MNKKGAIQIVAVILALVIFGMFLVNIAMRECNSNKDCSENAYCGTDYECHEYPQQIIVDNTNWVLAAFIFGISIIIATYIYKTGKIPFKDKFERFKKD